MAAASHLFVRFANSLHRLPPRQRRPAPVKIKTAYLFYRISARISICFPSFSFLFRHLKKKTPDLEKSIASFEENHTICRFDRLFKDKIRLLKTDISAFAYSILKRTALVCIAFKWPGTEHIITGRRISFLSSSSRYQIGFLVFSRWQPERTDMIILPRKMRYCKDSFRHFLALSERQ